MKKSLVIFLIALLLIISGCTSGAENLLISNLDDFQMISVEESYPIAKAEADNWRQEYYMDSIYIDVVPKTENMSTYIVFSFRSYEDPDIFLLIMISNKNGTLVLEKVTEDTFPIGRPNGAPIVIEEIPISSEDAFSRFYDTLGSEFYKNNRQINYPHILKLEQEKPAMGEGKIVWKITFSSSDDSVHARMDAYTGEIIEVRGQ
jgi:hypothetical protein